MIKKIGIGIGLLLPIVSFYAVSMSYGLNVPWFDDIENIPFFLSQWLDAGTWQARFTAMLRPNNEHRVLTARLLVYFNYLLTGQVNFGWLLQVGNLTVLGIGCVLARVYLKQGGPWLMLIAASFFIFNLQFYSMTFMTIMSLQYQLIICEVFLVLYLFIKERATAYFIAAIGVALLGTFSMGNGMMVWPTGALVLVLLARWQRLGIWLSVGVLAVWAYFSGYNIAQNNEAAFGYFSQNAFKVIVGFFVFVGGILDWFPTIAFGRRMLIPGLGGGFILGFFLFYVVGTLTVLPHWKNQLPRAVVGFYQRFDYFRSIAPEYATFWIGCFVFLLINSLLVVFFRTRFDYKLILWATYKIYPGTLMAISALLCVQIVPMRWKAFISTVFIMMAVASWASSYWHFIPEVQYQQKQRMAFALNQQRDGLGLGASKHSAFADFAVNSLQSAREKGFYKIPSPLIDVQEMELERTLRDTTIQYPIANIKVAYTPTVVEISNDDLTYLDGKNNGAFVVLYSPKYFYIFAGRPQSYKNGLTTRFKAFCPLGPIYEGQYQVAVWLVQNKGNKLFKTAQRVTIK